MTIVGHLGPEDSVEALHNLSWEELAARRLALHRELGEAARQLNDASTRYHDVIEAIIRANGVLGELSDGGNKEALEHFRRTLVDNIEAGSHQVDIAS